MCGIAGEYRWDGQPADVNAVVRMTETLRRRGPDDSGVWASGRVALGHRRLKIIDLSNAGAQPMIDSELGLSLVFNGCIYNHQQLRAELERDGYSFFSHSDSEVILKAYARWGTDCVDHFAGMFAFAVFERTTGRLVLARDRLGIKPLYLAEHRGRVGFASTLPALLAAGGVNTDLDPVAIHHYLTFHSVVPAPRTVLAGVQKLPAATVRTIEPDGSLPGPLLLVAPARPDDRAERRRLGVAGGGGRGGAERRRGAPARARGALLLCRRRVREDRRADSQIT